MSFLDLARRHASQGFYVFPAQPDNKRPVYGFKDWEGRASSDVQQITQWWQEYPEALPAVAPGVSGHAVIDVDRHEGSADGFASLSKENIVIPADVHTGTSLSGNGLHLWFSAYVGSLNGVIPGVDRKSRGGYVVAPYDLPRAIDIRTPLPERLAGSRLHSVSTRNFMSPAQLNYWLQTVGSGPISEPMWEIVERFQPKGNQQMSIAIARVVKLAAQGESGASRAFDKMMETWLSVVHHTGNPEEEFQVNVKSAIEKFGEPVEESDGTEYFWELATGERPFTLNRAELRETLLLFCDRLYPEWPTSEHVVEALKRCLSLIPAIQDTAGVEQWLNAAKQFMKVEIGKATWVTS